MSKASRFSLALLISLLLSAQALWAQGSRERPNIVLILADDLGYGDLSSYGATKIQTPNIDHLAREGMRFTDAHSPHSVCTPTRYGLLTGRYAWRTWNATMTVWSDDPLLIDTSLLTLPRLLQLAGYQTAIIGKWHLGFGAPGSPGWDDLKGPDYNKELKPGPLEVGFDYFYGVPHVGQEPHVLIENHRVVGLDPGDPLRIELDEKWQRDKVSHLERLGVPDHKFTGGNAAKYEHEDLAVKLTGKAVHWLEEQKHQPFFLYFAHRNPHGPIRPNARFKQTNKVVGPYGDFINELDWSVGEVLSALDRRGFSGNTIVIFASDNGGVTNYLPSRVAEINGHKLNGPFRGQKTEIYDGGNRVPLLVRWPSVVKPGTTSDAMVALTDVLATTADLLHAELPYDAAVDSFSFLHVLRGTAPNQPVRQDLVMDSHAGIFAVREGPWKLILGRDGGGIYSMAGGESLSEPPGQLYNLSSDPGETTNLYAQHAQIVARLRWRLKEIQFSGRSRPVSDADRGSGEAQRRRMRSPAGPSGFVARW